MNKFIEFFVHNNYFMTIKQIKHLLEYLEFKKNKYIIFIEITAANFTVL